MFLFVNSLVGVGGGGRVDLFKKMVFLKIRILSISLNLQKLTSVFQTL